MSTLKEGSSITVLPVGGGLTLEMLQKIMPNCKVGNQVLPILNATMREFEINNRQRAAAFPATLAVESGEYRYNEEIADGRAYENRKDLGNTQLPARRHKPQPQSLQQTVAHQ